MNYKNHIKSINRITLTNIIAAIAFVFVLILSNFSILSISTMGGKYFGPKIYGMVINGLTIPWYIMLAVMIALLAIFLTTLVIIIKTLLKNKLPLKAIPIITIISICILISTMVIALCEREEYASVVLKQYSISSVSLFPAYESINVDTSKKGYLLVRDNEIELKIKATKEAQELVEGLNSHNIVIAICIGYRKNLILSRSYKLSSIWDYIIDGAIYYKSGFQADEDLKWH